MAKAKVVHVKLPSTDGLIDADRAELERLYAELIKVRTGLNDGLARRVHQRLHPEEPARLIAEVRPVVENNATTIKASLEAAVAHEAKREQDGRDHLVPREVMHAKAAERIEKEKKQLAENARVLAEAVSEAIG